MAMALEGRVFAGNGGSGTSPITFAGAYSATAHDFGIDVPDGTVIFPVTVEAVIQTSGASLFEVIMMASRTLTAATGTAVNAIPLRTDAPFASNCTLISASSSSTTAVTTGSYEFYRSGYPTDPDVAGNPNPRYSFSALKEGIAPVITGDGSMNVHVSGTSGTGFVTAIWVELPESAVS
jgi:hypothetical protein